MTMNYTEASLVLKNENSFTLHTMIYTPADYGKEPNKKYPVLLFLHGAGERGEDYVLARKHGMGKLAAAGQDFPFIIVAPRCSENNVWWINQLEALLDHIIANYAVDTDRVYVTGLSMGGHGTWMLGAYIADRLAAIIPICGWGNALLAARYGSLPIWAFHGDKDDTVDYHYSEQLVNAINECGGNAMLTLYSEVGHNSWEQTYNDPAIYEWLLAQKLSDRKAK